MKSQNIFLAFFTISFLLVSCNDSLKNRMQELEKKEAELNEREKNFALKEADYFKLQKMRDSIFAKKDSTEIIALPDSLLGNWQNKMVCTESNCSDHVIGDQRTESWEISKTENVVVAKVFNRNTFVRLYSGSYDGNALRLSFKSDSETKNPVTMNIILDDFSGGKIRGKRTMVGSDNCVSKYSVELERK